MPEVTLSNDVVLAYDETGDPGSPPLVLLHGVSMSRRYFHRQLEPLSAQHRVLAVDLRGHGDSGKAESGHTIPQYARDVSLFMDALGIERPVVLGWSMGAFVAWDYISQFGTGRLAGLIISDEAASDFKWDDFPHGFIDLPTLHSLMSDVQADKDAFLRHLVPEMFHNEQPSEDVEWMVAECAKLPIGALSAILFDQSVQDYRETVATIDIPTLICWGRHDELLPVSGADDLRSRIPGGEVVIFEDSGHCPFIEETEKFNATVSEFVARVCAPAAS
jgi:pimeloyl-ACP methyl ester carboxylesterase